MKNTFVLLGSILLSSCATTTIPIKEGDLIGTWATSEDFDGQTLHVEESFLPTSMYCSAVLDFSSKDLVLNLAEGAWSMRDNNLEITVGETWPANTDSHMEGSWNVLALTRNHFEYEITNILALKRFRTLDRGDYWCKLLRQLKGNAR